MLKEAQFKRRKVDGDAAKEPEQKEFKDFYHIPEDKLEHNPSMPETVPPIPPWGNGLGLCRG